MQNKVSIEEAINVIHFCRWSGLDEVIYPIIGNKVNKKIELCIGDILKRKLPKGTEGVVFCEKPKPRPHPEVYTSQKCKHFKTYKATRPPKCSCKACWELWKTKQKKMK